MALYAKMLFCLCLISVHTKFLEKEKHIEKAYKTIKIINHWRPLTAFFGSSCTSLS